MASLRPAQDGDRAALYEICLQTGERGGDARALYRDPELLGHVYVGPYLQLARACCFVLEDGAGVGGYVVGTCDTAAFEKACAARWWPALQQRYELPPAEDRSPDGRRLRQIFHPVPTPAALAASHRAHLHINLLPRLQGCGWGTRLVDHFRAVAAAQGAAALHLIAGAQNPRALAFYRHYGFQELGRRQEAVAFGIATA